MEGCVPGLECGYRLIGSVASHSDFVQLYVRAEVSRTRLPDVPGVPAVLATLRLGKRRVIVASVHLSPHAEGADKRREQMVALASFMAKDVFVAPSRLSETSESPSSCVCDSALVLGDFNVRQEEVLDLLEVGQWREAGYHGKSWDPRVNCFDATLRGQNVSGQCFDRVWFRGALWVQAFLVGQCRLFRTGVLIICPITFHCLPWWTCMEHMVPVVRTLRVRRVEWTWGAYGMRPLRTRKRR